ncbi:izumo sperm-egg fusion protein 1 isoform X2 [Brachyhypopomus gauderio]|uniref:izumo sperm-egg fusion protein 1 isoform X2 n=1 Tax=Brachyhypopomus gauderio TaxID=698409 RepID=UPI004040FC84
MAAAGRLPLCCLCLLCALSSVSCCLQCDRLILHMHEDFIATVGGITVQDQMDLEQIVDHAYATFRDTSEQSVGLIDPTTLYRAQTEYQSEFMRHWQEPRTDSIQWHMIKIVEKGKRILQKHLELFAAEGLCPNKCGLLFQSVMNCSSCQYGLHTCLSGTPPQDCGEFLLQAEEGQQVLLDCFLSWHKMVVGQTEYQYSWIQGARNFSAEDDFEVLALTEDSKIVLNQLTVSDQGVYRCLLLDKENTALSRMYFMLTVIPLPSSTPRPIPTLPSLPRSDSTPGSLHIDTLLITVATLTALSMLASLVILAFFRAVAFRVATSQTQTRSVFNSSVILFHVPVPR